MRTLICLLSLAALCASAQTNSPLPIDWAKLNPQQRFQSPMFVTPAYQKEALGLLIAEANRVAKELNLPEKLPITETNLVETHIFPPRMARLGIGNIKTSNYVYYVSAGGKFSSVARMDSEKTKNELKAKYLWPMSRMDTNAAYQLATQWLTAVSMDVAALNRDCKLVISAWTPEGENGQHFVPLYSVYWVAKGEQGHGNVAGVELLEPTKSLQQLYVKKPEYILRKPLQITNPDYLFSQTNIPSSLSPLHRRPQRSPFTNSVYRNQ
jgi:hypothetical protein